MKYVSPLRVAALACNITLRTLPAKITLNFPDNVSNMTYSHFLKFGRGFSTSYNTVTYFSIHFVNVLSLCRRICYVVFHMLFPNISKAVIDYTCITSVSEYSKSIRLKFKFPYDGVLHYFYSPGYLRYPPNTMKRSRYGREHDMLVLICMLAQVYVLLFTLAH